jgi:hypothetical protein
VSPPVDDDEWDTLLKLPGPSMSFEIERSERAVVEQPMVTFSTDAMDTLVGSLIGWVTTRLVRSLDAGITPRRMQVAVSVEINGKDAT